MAVELEYFRLFFEVARQENITRAAEALHLSQPTATIELHKLEAQLGIPLFIRHSKGVKLTPEGEYLYGRLRPVMSDLLELEAEAEDIGRLKTGVVRISFNNVPSLYTFQPYIEAFQTQYPDIMVQTHILPRSSVQNLLKTGGIDISFAGRPGDMPRPAIRQLPGVLQDSSGKIREFSLGSFEDVILAHNHLPVDTDNEISFKTLSHYHIIYPPEPDNRRQDYYMRFMRKSNRFIGLDNIDSVLQLLSLGDFIAIVPGLYTSRYTPNRSIRFLKMKEPLLKTEYLLHYSAERHMGLAAVNFLKFITECKELDYQELPCSI
ncbi:MAG: LysR family transcriptional regulator [Lachnospiraceae bacterium]|nr:LysR family transcriptional regulator [Lachnospiraceae bacterium]